MNISGICSLSVSSMPIPSSRIKGRQNFLTEMESMRATTLIGNWTDDEFLQKVYDQLSDSSKGILSNLQSGKPVEKDAWKGLCKELLDQGQITESEYQCTNLDYRLIPLGSHDSSGNFVRYNNTAEIVLASRSLNQWTGHPLEMLDTWSFLFRKWGSQLALEYNPDGTPKYQNLSPISNQASACQKIADLINGLITTSIGR